jgi:hypothetical protein
MVGMAFQVFPDQEYAFNCIVEYLFDEFSRKAKNK